MDELSDDHPIDCIFWYPTVNRSEDPTSYDFSDPAPMLSSIRAQAARFSRVCKELTATWGLFRNFFSAECVEAPSGGQALVIDYTDDPDDMRTQFLDLSVVIGFGLHVFDYALPMDDLVELVRTQREAKLAARP